MSAKDKHEITAPLTSPTPTSLPSSHTFEASTCSEVCTGHKHASGDLLQVTSYKASSLKPPATSGLKPSAQVLSSNPFTSQTPTTFQDPQTLVSKTAEVTKLEHPFRNTAEAITPLSSGDLASFFTPSFDYKTQATSLPTCSLDHPAQGLDSQRYTPELESPQSTKLSRTTKDLRSLPRISFSSGPALSATFEVHSENQSPRVSDRLAALKVPKIRSKESPALDKRSPSFTKSLSSSINSYATAEDSSPHVSGFLARHRSQDRAPSIPRSVSFGTARELRSTALASFKERSYSISGPTVPSRSASLVHIQEVEILRSVRSQPVSISSTEELHDLLSLNTEPLFIDVERRRNHDFVFPRSTLITIPPVATPRRRSSAKSRSFSIPRQASPSPSLGVPLIYRSASAATLHDPHRRKEPVFVPARIHHQQRSTDETMATQGSTNPFDNASPVWQGDCPVRAASAMAQPPRVPAHGVAALVAATALAQPPAAVVRAPAPRRRGFFRRLRDRLRRLVGKD